MTAPATNQLPSLEDYREAHGEIGEDDFKAALGVVADLVGTNDIAGGEDAWRRAVMAVVAVDAAYGFSHGVGEGLASVTLGKFSASLGASDGVSQWRTDAVAAARRELAWTGLLYTGVPA